MDVQHDVIPRASLWAFEALREEVASTSWEQELKDQVSPADFSLILLFILPLWHCSQQPDEWCATFWDCQT